MVLDRGGGWLGCAGQVDDLCESEPQRLPGNRVKKMREPVNQVCGTTLRIFGTIVNLRLIIGNFWQS